MRPPELEIQETQEDRWRRLTLLGELDLANCRTLEDRLQELRHDHRAVLMDRSRLEFIDSTGLSVMVESIASASADGWRFAIGSELSPQVRRVFRITCLDRFVGVKGTDV